MDIVYKIDEIIREFDHKKESDQSKSRKLLRNYLQEYAEVEINNDLTLPQTIVFIERSSPANSRNIAMMVLHALVVATYLIQVKQMEN